MNGLPFSHVHSNHFASPMTIMDLEGCPCHGATRPDRSVSVISKPRILLIRSTIHSLLHLFIATPKRNRTSKYSGCFPPHMLEPPQTFFHHDTIPYYQQTEDQYFETRTTMKARNRSFSFNGRTKHSTVCSAEASPTGSANKTRRERAGESPDHR